MRSIVVQRPKLFGLLSLFASFGTLMCCALPSLLVLFGLGATVASFLAGASWLVTLSRHKVWVFSGAGVLIATNFVYVYAIAPRLRTKLESCAPDDPSECAVSDRVSRAVLWVSAFIYVIGFFTAYILGPLLVRFG
jgi:hypothetical protein